MLKGFARPLTPHGKASPLPALPWRFAGDLLLIHFRTDPKALAAYLPEPLEPSEAPGEAFLWSPHLKTYPVEGDWKEVGPARTHYNVAVLSIPCKFQGKPTMLSAFQWCDRDWLVIFSWFLGTCSKLAQFEQSGTHPMFPVSGSTQTGGPGTLLKRRVSRHGECIMSMSVTPTKKLTMDDMGFYTRHMPLTCIRQIPDCDVSRRGEMLVHDMTQMVMSNFEFGDIWGGDATLDFADADNEELLPLQPKEVMGGYLIPMAFILEGIKVVYDYKKGAN